MNTQIETASRPRCLTPTEKQVQALDLLTPEQLLARAMEALHALNRRAKEKRDRVNEYRKSSFSGAVQREIDDIYALKNRLLAALVAADKARVFVFKQIHHGAAEFECPWCERTFHVRVPWGYQPEGAAAWCYRCDTEADLIDDGRYTSSWYIVEALGYRFHQPDESATDKMREVAEPCEPHDPTQPQREIPDVGLTIEAQRRCVLKACWMLEHEVASTNSTTTIREPSVVPGTRTEGVG